MNKTGKKTILIIEQLSVCNFFFFNLTKGRGTSWSFIHCNSFLQALFQISFISSWIKRRINKLEFADLPGSYFIAEDEGYLYSIDSAFERHQDNLFVRICREFCKDSLYVMALKKEYFNRYTQRRIKSYTLIDYLIDQNPGNRIIFIPQNSEDFSVYLSDNYRHLSKIHIPGYFKFYLHFKHGISSILSILTFPFFLLAISGKFTFRGIRKKPPVRQFSFALDNFNSGINWKNPYEFFFLYDGSTIQPKQTLQVVRNTFDDSAHARKTAEFFQRDKIPWIEHDRISVPLDVFKNLVLKDFLAKGIIRWIRSWIGSDISSQYLLPAIAVMKMRLDAEIFYSQYAVSVFIARDEYSPYHIVRTAVAKSYGYKTAGFSHGDDCHHTAALNYLVFDRYALWGDFYVNHLKKSLKMTQITVIGAGIYGLDKTYEWQSRSFIPKKYRYLKEEGKKIIGIFASSFTHELYITKELTIRFYEDVLNSTERYSSWYRIIKPKGNEFDDPDFKKILEGHKNVILENDMWTYRLMTALDVIVCINASTIGLEGLVAKKPVFYYEVSNNRNHHGYTRYDPQLVAYDKKTLERNLELFFSKNQYLSQEKLNEIISSHAFRFDGNVVSRFRAMCYDLLHEVKTRSKMD